MKWYISKGYMGGRGYDIDRVSGRGVVELNDWQSKSRMFLKYLIVATSYDDVSGTAAKLAAKYNSEKELLADIDAEGIGLSGWEWDQEGQSDQLVIYNSDEPFGVIGTDRNKVAEVFQKLKEEGNEDDGVWGESKKDAIDKAIDSMLESKQPAVRKQRKILSESRKDSDVAFPDSPEKMEKVENSYVQYIRSHNEFSPAGKVQLVDALPPFAYKVQATPQGIVFEKTGSKTDELYLFESSKMTAVLREIQKFWTLKDNFDQFGYLHNRGILMYGPPGSGKSALIQQVAEAMVKQGDTIFFSTGIYAVREGLNAFRQIEPDRRAVVVFEDLDEYCNYDERALLQLLDGADAVDNVLYLGTTNYIERFPPRLLRPGRFDKKVEIGFPPIEGRLVYLRKKLAEIADEATIQKLAQMTDGFSFGHLRELIVGSFVFEEPVEEVIERLKDVSYMKLPRREDGIKESQLTKKAKLVLERVSI